MITFLAITVINTAIWVPTICKATDKGEAAVVGTLTYALSLCTVAAVRFLLGG